VAPAGAGSNTPVVKPSTTPTRGFLDDIKQKNFQLRKQSEFKPLADKPIKNAAADMDSLSVADLQVALQKVREAMQCSDDASSSTDEENSSTW
jgi:hypothetical protein